MERGTNIRSSHSPNLDDFSDNAEDITVEEIDKDLEGLKNNTAPASRGISIQLVQHSSS